MKPDFRCYGENSFTFIFFQWLASGDGSRLSAFLNRLKPFGKSKSKLPISDSAKEAQVWLFPNFGKAHGFGEPDALVLVDGYSFWFEIETEVDFVRRKAATRNALRQLLRFRLLAEALARRSNVRMVGSAHLAYSGPTISNNGSVRPAILKKKGKAVIQAVANLVEQSIRAKKDHYVLLTEKEPDNVSKDGVGRHFLEDLIQTNYNKLEVRCEETGYSPIPQRPKVNQFWYMYWEGDLKKLPGAANLLESSGYVSIAK